MTTTEPTIAASYGMAPPPWLDLEAIVSTDELKALHDQADRFFNSAEPFLAEARALMAAVAAVEAKENAAIAAFGGIDDGEVEEGLAHLLSGLTGTQAIRMVIGTVSNVLHPDDLERGIVRAQRVDGEGMSE